MEINILHISTPLSWRGGEQQLAYLIEELAKHKEVNQVVCCAANSKMQTFCEEQKITHVTTPKRTPYHPFSFRKVHQICEEYSIDLIHTHDAHAHTIAWLSSVYYKKSPPIIVSRRVDFAVKKKYFSLKKYNAEAVKKIVCVSDLVRQITAPAILDRDKLVVVHDGINPNKFKYGASDILREEFRIPKDVFLIGKVAAIAPHKDYFTFVNTVEKLVVQKIKAHFFIIGGDGGEERNIRNYVKEKKLGKHISFTRHRTDIPKILPELDLFLFTSKTEGLGTSVLDALACKVPVVSTNAGGVPEIIKDEINGLLAPVGDANKLSEQVIRILNNSKLRAQIIKEGINTLENFTKEKMAQKTLEIYLECTTLIKNRAL